MGPLRSYFGPARAVDVRGSTVEQYKAMRLATPTRRKALVQPASLNREPAALRWAFKLGIAQERIASAPAITLLAEHNARQGFVEPGTFAEIVRHLPAPLARSSPRRTDRPGGVAFRDGGPPAAEWRWLRRRGTGLAKLHCKQSVRKEKGGGSYVNDSARDLGADPDRCVADVAI
jgi:hypothetical protein